MKSCRHLHWLILLLLLLSFPGCKTRKPRVLKRTQFIMGTVVEITLVAHENRLTDEAFKGAFEELRRIEALMSRWIAGSDVSRVNRNAGIEPVTVNEDLLAVIRVALETSALSEGAFDVTVGRLVTLWGQCRKEDRIPSKEEVEGALRLVGYQNLEMDEERGSLFLRKAGMEIVPGGIAKGYGVDRAFDFLLARGFRDLIVNAGGDLRVGGSRFGAPWKVGIQNPRDDSKLLATLEVNDSALATSGDYERFFVKDGVRYHHILDPFSGFPAGKCQSVTVLSSEGVWADALATAVLVMGPEKGMDLIERLPRTEAVIVDREGSVSISSGLGGRLKLEKPAEEG